MPTMLCCWGNGSFGQLGLGEDGVSEPLPFRLASEALGGPEVVLVACGERHSLLLRADGSVASCGDNAQGQLGRRLPPGQRRAHVPEQIQALETQTIVHVSCGKEHSLAVCNNGRVFSWGAGAFGQLGTGELKERLIPKKVDGLSKYKIIQVACGNYHSIALAKDGRVFSWGQNTHGQLGLGKRVTNQAGPQQISALDGIPLAQVAAGGSQSFALSLSGVVYGWGKNNAHQLGLSQADPKEQIFKPHSIAALRKLDVIYVSCGDEHTAVLTQDGSVFTFGDDSAGQLGRSSSDLKTGPEKLGSVDGPVSHLACGSYHTVCISASGQLISFGRGRQQQHNGSGPSSSKSDGRRCFNISALVSPNELLGVRVKQIFAGPYVTFATVLRMQDSAYANEPTSMETLPKISLMDRELMEKWLLATAESVTRQTAKREIEAIFSSPPCLTASFLKPRSAVETGCCVAVDLQKAREMLEELATRDWIAGRIFSSLLDNLIPALPLNSPHQEALSSFLLLPECCAALEAQKMQRLGIPFAKAVNGLSRRSLDILEKYWSFLPASHLDRIVQMLKKVVLSQLPCYPYYPACQELLPLLEVLKKLYKVNRRANCKLPLSNFYIDEIRQIISPFADLGRWHVWIDAVKMDNEDNCPISLCCFPFVYNLLTKMEIFDYESYFLQEIVKANARDTLVRNRLLRKDELPKLPVFPLRVRRKNLVEDTLRKLSQVEDISLKMQLLLYSRALDLKPSCAPEQIGFRFLNVLLEPKCPTRVPRLQIGCRSFLQPVRSRALVSERFGSLFRSTSKIEFEGEMPGHETGGVLFEFFSYVFEEMVQPDYGMFMCCEQNSPIWFPSRPSVEKNKYLFFGILCGLSMFNRVTAYVPFPLAAFKKLLGKKPTLEDLKELSPVLGRSLQAVLDYEHDDFEKNHELTYNISWDDVDVDLIPNGSSVAVNNSNKKDFVNKYVDYVFNKSVEEIFQEFKRGFYKVLDERMVAFFEPQELMDVAIGNANYDWELYEKNTVYWGIYSEMHPTIRMFWKVFHELILADKKGFLLFVLGSDRVPVVGMDSLKLTIHSHKSLSEEHIPEAQICFHLLLLPPYSTTGKLKEKLLQAIENNRGFGKQL